MGYKPVLSGINYFFLQLCIGLIIFQEQFGISFYFFEPVFCTLQPSCISHTSMEK